MTTNAIVPVSSPGGVGLSGPVQLSWGDRLRLRALEWITRGFDDVTNPQVRRMLSGVFGGTIGEPPKRDVPEFLKAYSELPWLRTAVQRIAEQVASVHWEVSARTNRKGKAILDESLQRAPLAVRTRELRRLKELGELKKIEQTPFLDALTKGNGMMTGLGVRYLMAVYHTLVGEVAFFKERGEWGVPTALWPIPPSWILQTPTPTHPRFRVSYRTWQQELPDSDVFWYTEPDPVNPYGRGSGMARALADELDADEYAAKFMRGFFYNRAAPNLIVSGEELANRDNVKRLQDVWKAKYGNRPDKAHEPFFTSAKIDVKEVGQKVREMQLPELREFGRDVVIQFFGLPPEILGIVENSNRSTIESADYLMARYVLTPRLEVQREAFQQRLAPEYDERYIVGYVSPIQEDKEFRLKAMTAAPWAATADEWRAVQGFAEKEDGSGKVHMVPINLEPRESLDVPVPTGDTGGDDRES
jgi:hypothetical protein